MSDSTKPAKSKSTKPKAPPSHPKYSEMVASAIKSLNQKGGSSKAAIVKYVTANYEVGNNAPRINGNVKLTLKQGVLKRTLTQTKGVGATGSFKLRKAEAKGEKKQKKVKRPAKVGKKPATKKNKSAKPKRAASRSTKSPKSAKPRVVKPKQVAAKKPAKKVTKKKVVKKPTTKKATKK